MKAEYVKYNLYIVCNHRRMNEYVKYGLYGGAALGLAVEYSNIKLGKQKTNVHLHHTALGSFRSYSLKGIYVG